MGCNAIRWDTIRQSTRTKYENEWRTSNNVFKRQDFRISLPTSISHIHILAQRNVGRGDYGLLCNAQCATCKQLTRYMVDVLLLYSIRHNIQAYSFVCEPQNYTLHFEWNTSSCVFDYTEREYWRVSVFATIDLVSFGIVRCDLKFGREHSVGGAMVVLHVCSIGKNILNLNTPRWPSTMLHLYVDVIRNVHGIVHRGNGQRQKQTKPNSCKQQAHTLTHTHIRTHEVFFQFKGKYLMENARNSKI